VGAHAVRWTYAHRRMLRRCASRIAAGVARGGFCPPSAGARRHGTGGTVELLVIGFPLGLAATDRFAPIRKHYHAASEVVRLCGEEMSAPADFFLLDSRRWAVQRCAGVRGAARRVDRRRRRDGVGAALRGVVSQTISDEAGGQFAAVAPSRVIRRLLNRVRRAGVGS